MLHQFHFSFSPLSLCLPSGVGNFLSCLLFFLFKTEKIIGTVFEQRILDKEAFSSTATRRNSARKTRVLSTTIPFDVLSITKSTTKRWGRGKRMIHNTLSDVVAEGVLNNVSQKVRTILLSSDFNCSLRSCSSVVCSSFFSSWKRRQIFFIRTTAICLTRIKEELKGRLKLWVYLGEISCDIFFVLLARLLSLFNVIQGFHKFFHRG